MAPSCYGSGMDAARLSLFIGPAIAHHRHELGVGGPTLQKRQGKASPAGFYRQEGRVVPTRWGRVCFQAPLRDPHIGTLLEIEQALGIRFGTLIATAQVLHDEHEAAVVQGMAETKLSRDDLIAQIRAGEWRATTSA